jgi:hypothetical protein
VILSTGVSRSQSKSAHAVPLSHLNQEFLKVDGVAGDKAKWKIGPRRIFQRANARFLAFCRLGGTGKIANPAIEDEI